MAISEQHRHQLFARLEQVLGPVEAATLMEHLPPMGWADVATRRDLEATSDRLGRSMAELRSELKVEMADLKTELKSEMAELRTELKSEMAELRTELRAGLAGVRAEIGGTSRTLFYQGLGLQLSAAALVVAVSRLV